MSDATSETGTDRPARTHCLYRFFDADGVLLYVGLTGNLISRMKQHRSDKPWWIYVRSSTVEHFASRADLVLAEAKAIHDERPLWNARRPSRPAESPALPLRAEPHANQFDADGVPWGFRTIEDDLAARIARGEFRAGDRVPTYKELSEAYASSVTTIQRALFSLKFKGIIVGHQGKGLYVAGKFARR